jgi:transposase InsO family protein
MDFIRTKLGVREASRISGIPLSLFYYRPRKRSVTRLDPSVVEDTLRVASDRPTYGYRRVWAVLRNKGTAVNPKSVRRLLRINNLSLPYAKHKGRTKSRNLLRPTGPDQLWETDITYIPTQQGITYLMCVKDSFTKEWQGYNYSRSCLSKDAIMSVDDAVMRTFDRGVPEGLTLRTDNGPQYNSQEFRSSMNVMSIALEYIKKHTPEDNGDIESFHNSIKTDYIWPFEFRNYSEASVAIEKAFKDYNEHRPHSSIDYLPPREFRRRFLEDQSFREKYVKKLEVKLNDK